MPGKFQVEITAVAETDVEEIWEYIAQDTIDAANSLVLHLEEQIGRLEIFPLRCPIVPENELLGTNYRHLLYDNYRIIFKIIDSRVVILRVVHMARLLDTERL
ncbi:MAG: type II toxin-antitoxin system RelE/ParE family toxin [Methanomicrobiales archaeon]|nr:type II toxin-antitoxin system RelE/ParE family toxin [Methanomicrobiales archaeon]